MKSLQPWVFSWHVWSAFVLTTSLSLWRASHSRPIVTWYNPRPNPALLQHGTSFLGAHVWSTPPLAPKMLGTWAASALHFFSPEGNVLKMNIYPTNKISTNQPAERIPLLVWTTLSLSIWPGLSNWNPVFDSSIADVPEGMQPSGFPWRVVIFLRWIWNLNVYYLCWSFLVGWQRRKSPPDSV